MLKKEQAHSQQHIGVDEGEHEGEHESNDIEGMLNYSGKNINTKYILESLFQGLLDHDVVPESEEHISMVCQSDFLYTSTVQQTTLDETDAEMPYGDGLNDTTTSVNMLLS